MKSAFFAVLAGVVAALFVSPAANADTRKAPMMLHGAVKSFACTVSVFHQTEYVKQGRSSNESFQCAYRCIEDFNLICQDQSDACPKLVSVHWDNRKYDLSGTGKGTAVGLDVDSVIKGDINRQNGAVKYTTEERHTFQGDPIFIKSARASGTCRPDRSSARPARRDAPPATKARRHSKDWDE